MSFKFFIKEELDGNTRTVCVEELKNMTVEELKIRLYHEENDKHRLFYAGKQLEDHRKLADYGIKHQCTIHETIRLRGGGFPSSSLTALLQPGLSFIFQD